MHLSNLIRYILHPFTQLRFSVRNSGCGYFEEQQKKSWLCPSGLECCSLRIRDSMTFKTSGNLNAVCSLLTLLSTFLLRNKLSCCHCKCHATSRLGSCLLLASIHSLQYKPTFIPSILFENVLLNASYVWIFLFFQTELRVVENLALSD